ncbi:alpha-amylase family glycosyl hydrolase, partial [Bacteroidota bacterium]
SLNSCNNEKTPKITDVINPLHLTAGKISEYNVRDLFYSQNYELEFTDNPNLSIDYNLDNQTLKLNPDSNYVGISLVEFKADMNYYQIPIVSKKEKYYEFTFKPLKEYELLTLFGSFNGWNRQELIMTDRDEDGVYKTKVPLEPGVYQYKFFGDGEEIVDPQNPITIPNGLGDFNSVITIEETDTTALFLHIDGYEPRNDNRIYKFIVEYSLKKNITKENIIALLNNSKIESNRINIADNKISIQLNKKELNGKNYLRTVVSLDEKVSNIQQVVLFDGNPADNNNFTWYDGIIYSLMIDRFSDGNPENNNPVIHDSLNSKANYMGGDLKGIVEKINSGYFDSLGINILWVSPVYDNPNKAYREYPAPNRYYAGYHGYWPIDHYKIDEHFGDLEILKTLVSTAHTGGIKILLDYVSNHVHEQNPIFKEHRDWFGILELPDGRLNLRFWDEFRLTTWFEPYLPSFDYLGAPEAIEAMTSNAVWWLKETGADGYRHDAVKHVPNTFWRALNKKLRDNLEDERDISIYQVGETFGSYDLISSYVNNGQLNAQFNFNLYDVALPTFIRNDASFYGLDKEMHKTFSVYGYLHLMGNVMDSHDKNRFMSFADSDLDVSQWSAIEEGWENPPQVNKPENYKKLTLYMAYMNTVPGLPVIYYGSEFGMTGASDPDNRRMMRFGNDLSAWEKNTLNEVRSIINIRRNHPALRYGDFYTLKADQYIYAYLRTDFNERILVLLNKGSGSREIGLDFPEFFDVKDMYNLKTNDKISNVKNKINLTIPGRNWLIYKLL